MESLYDASSTVLSRTTYIFNKKDFCDVELIVGNQQYRGHKLLLSLASRVFAQKLQDSVASNEIDLLDIPDTDPAIFYKILKYIYTDDIELDTVTEACHIFIFAHNYEILSLRERCQKYINKKLIPPDQAVKMFETAPAADLRWSGVREMCLCAFANATKGVFKSASFLKARRSTVEVIVKMDKLAVDSEMDVLLAILEWGKSHCRVSGLSIDISLRASVEQFLKHIRFLTIPLSDLKTFWKSYSNFMTSEEVCALTITLLKPGSGTEMPQTLCSLKRARSLPYGHKVETRERCSRDPNSKPRNSTAVEVITETPAKILNIFSPPLNDSIKNRTNSTKLMGMSSKETCLFRLLNKTSQMDLLRKAVAKKITEHESSVNNVTSKIEKNSSKTVSSSTHSPNSCVQVGNVLKDSEPTSTMSKTYHGPTVPTKPVSDSKPKISTGTRTAALSQKLAKSSESEEEYHSSSESCATSESHTKEEMSLKKYKAINFKLDGHIEIPRGWRAADIKTIIKFSVTEGFVEIIGIRMQLRNISAAITCRIHIRFESDGKNFERVDSKVVSSSSPFNMFFKNAVCLQVNKTAKIFVTVEDIQLHRSSMCILPHFSFRERGNRYVIEINSNQLIGSSDVPVLVSGILYNNVSDRDD